MVFSEELLIGVNSQQGDWTSDSNWLTWQWAQTDDTTSYPNCWLQKSDFWKTGDLSDDLDWWPQLATLTADPNWWPQQMTPGRAHNSCPS